VWRGENNKQTTATHSLSLSFLGAERESGEMAFMLSRQRAEDGLKKKKPLRRQNENEDDQTALLSYFVIR